MSPSSARHRICDPKHRDIEVASPSHSQFSRIFAFAAHLLYPLAALPDLAARGRSHSRPFRTLATRPAFAGRPSSRSSHSASGSVPAPPPITLAPRRAPSRRIDMPLSRLSVPRPSSLALASASDDRNATGPPIPRYRSHDALPCPSADGLRLWTKVTPPVQAHPAGHRPFATRFRAAHLSRVAVGTHGLDRCTLFSLYPPMKNHITLTLFALFRAFSYHA